MTKETGKLTSHLLCGAAVLSIVALTGVAQAEELTKYRIAPQSLDQALREFGAQSGHPMLVNTTLVGAKKSPGVFASVDSETALSKLLAGTGLSYMRKGEVFTIVAAKDDRPRRPMPSAEIVAAETVSGSAVEGLVVTAQKRREQIQDVPIAISAFSADALRAQKIEGGFDLLKAIPNVTFSKNNFSGYNFTIRGIGTKAISVTTDPGVAVEFNSTSLIRNRLFEQEYFDIERVEVLRGPQGTLHGRNATAGVINVISNKADVDEFAGSVKGEVGNYHTKRLSGFVNVPLVEDVLAVRFAGSLTNREGYDFNETTEHAINGRDLWSGRLSIAFEPTEHIHADFIWERFNEDDNRSRTGKQLCTRDQGPDAIGAQGNLTAIAQSYMSQGCQNASLYDDAAYGTPNGLAIPFVLAAALAPNGIGDFGMIGYDSVPGGTIGVGPHALINGDPYGGLEQSRDLHRIASIKDPLYRAQADIFELNVDFDITESLTLSSLTAYNSDDYYSTQDFNRFNTVPVFNSTDGLFRGNFHASDELALPVTPGGVFCDPQIGCTNTIAGFDISKARSNQFSQELRLTSNFSGPFNFAIGANYTRYRTVEDYYVLFNVISALTSLDTLIGQGSFSGLCTGPGRLPYGSPDAGQGCIYVDPNPIETINGEGHNYYRSSNPYTLKSAAAFGEVTWQATPELKIIAGLRYTDDQKVFTPIPTQTLLSSSTILAGTVDRGYPALPNVDLQWQEVSGRFGGQWSPNLSFTDETMVYAFYSRGYKGGGMNPPGIGYNRTPFGGPSIDCSGPPFKDTLLCQPWAQVLPYPPNFEPEFVNAYELGSKNTLFGGGLIVNGDVFFYDYKGYQVSQIKNRTAVNENFDAHVWGAELESVWQPTERLRFNLALGYQGSKIADGTFSLDLMDRLQGHDEYTILKPFVQLPGNCVVLKSVVEQYVAFARTNGYLDYAPFPTLCPGSALFNQARQFNGPLTDPDIFPGSPGYPFNEIVFPNQAQGFFADVSGNSLPNAPHWTQSIGVQYTQPFLDGWEATIRADFYHQSQSWARVYEDAIDKLHGWKNANMVITISKPEEDLVFEFYVKNIFDDNAITDTFLNSDDSALTTNVFTLDPRLIGLSVTKGF